MSIFSGEPLPVQPNIEDPEAVDRFHFKVLEYLRRLAAKLDGNLGGGGTGPPGPPGPATPLWVPSLVMLIQWEPSFGSPNIVISTQLQRTIPWNISGKDPIVPWDLQAGGAPWVDWPFDVQPDHTIIVREDGLYKIDFQIQGDMQFTHSNVGASVAQLPLIDARITVVPPLGQGWAFIPRNGFASQNEVETLNYSGTFPLLNGTRIIVECVVYWDDLRVSPPAIPQPIIPYFHGGTGLQIYKLTPNSDGGNHPNPPSGPGAGWNEFPPPWWGWQNFGY